MKQLRSWHYFYKTVPYQAGQGQRQFPGVTGPLGAE